MLCSIAMLLCICQITAAEDNRPMDNFDSNLFEVTAAKSETEASAIPDKKTAPVATEETDWQPKLAITLTTSPEGISVMRQVTKQLPTYVSEYEDKEIRHDDETVKVAVQKLTWCESKQSISLPGSVQVQCDGMNVEMATSTSGPTYSFECNGRLILQTPGSSIVADFGSYPDGTLTLANAKIQYTGMAMTAEPPTTIGTLEVKEAQSRKRRHTSESRKRISVSKQIGG